MKNLPFFSCIFGKFVLSLFPDKITIKNYKIMTTKLYNDGINKMQTIIFDANEKLAEIVKETFFTVVKEIELNRYFRIGETDYDTIKRVALRRGVIYVYYPNYRKEYAWVKLTSLTPNKIVSVYKELCSQMLKNN